jgi:YidC/Oxa1 family membrane protein insertase
MNKMNFSANKNENNFKKISSLICFFAFLGFLLMPVQLSGQIKSQQNDASCVIADVDGDGFRDATIETKLFRTIISSKTGAPSVYFLKGSNFEENMYPPVLQDLGYSFTPETMKPFVGRLQDGNYADKGFNVELEEENVDKIVVRANANLGGEASGSKKLGMAVIYTFFNGSYHFEVDYVISNLEEKLVAVGNEKNGALTLTYGPGLFMDPFGESSILGLAATEDESFSAAAAVNKSETNFTGIGLKNQYFTVFMDAKTKVKVGATEFEVKAADDKKKKQTGHTISLTLPQFNLGAKESRSFSFRIYFGPILLDQLKGINRGMVSEYGFLSTILLRILQFFYSLIPNYGLAIILLTIVVRLVLYPLTLKQTKSMAHMQKIQPKVQDLKDRYKDSPQKFNEEVLKLYQKHNVNPLGGCLPLLLQLPILIALYNTIRIAVELRKTPFLWISDLSKGDPLLILPIAIAALMYYQQGKMTDPQQRQMMAFMPMFMFVITWSLPAGLLVYWFASSVIGLLQQLQANRIAEAIKEE